MKIAWDKLERTALTIERVAIVITALFVGFQTKIIADHTRIFAEQAGTAVKHYEASLDASIEDRSSQWASRLVEEKTWNKWANVDKFFRETPNETKRMERIERDRQLQSDFHSVLALLEELAYFYNSNKLDKEFIRRTSSAPIIRFYDQSRFWIEYRRRQAGEKLVGKDLEDMAEDLKKSR